MDEPKRPGRWKRGLHFTAAQFYAGIVQVVAGALLMLIVCALLRPWSVEVPVPGPTVTVQGPVIVLGPHPAGVEYAPTMGWVPDAATIADNLNPTWTAQFDQTPAGRAALGDDDVFLWQAIKKVNPSNLPWTVDQGPVGCCVGAGWAQAANVCQAMQILNGKRAEWKPLSAEVIYGNSRVEIGGGRISGDGSVGAWAKEAAEKCGMAPMERFASADLTAFSPSRARQFGATGVPRDINDVAKLHPVKGCALAKSWTDVKRAVQQGYPVAVCSNQGFTMQRDADGFCRPQGVWNHCMSIHAVRGGKRPGGFVLNNWGAKAHTGPVWPADMPVEGFWADADTIDRMVRQGDSFALSDLTGFPARKVPLDWFIVAPVRPDPFTFRGVPWLAA